MTDNDFKDGLMSILASKIQTRSRISKFFFMGLKDKTAGHHTNVDNIPPRASEIISKINQIIKNN